MPDPFIVRERFQGKRGSNLNSASLVTGLGAAVPGSGAAAAGAKLQGASDRLMGLYVKQRNTQNALLAKSNTTAFAMEAQKDIQQLEKNLQWNPETNSWGVPTDVEGKEVSYYEAVSSRLGSIRDKYLVGERYQDEAYEQISANFFQNTLLRAAARGLQLDADRQKKNYEIQIDAGANLSGITVGEQLTKAKAIGESIPVNDLLIQNDGFVNQHFKDLKDAGLDISKKAEEELLLDTRSRYSEQLLNQLLLQGELSTAEEVLELGLKQSAAYTEGKGKGWEESMRLGGSFILFYNLLQ